MKLFAILMMTALFAARASAAQEFTCTSSPVYAGCFVAQADLKVDLARGTYVLDVTYDPLCPQWPPFKRIEGRVTQKQKGADILFYDEKDQVIGQLGTPVMRPKLYGQISGYSFLGCGDGDRF